MQIKFCALFYLAVACVFGILILFLRALLTQGTEACYCCYYDENGLVAKHKYVFVLIPSHCDLLRFQVVDSIEARINEFLSYLNTLIEEEKPREHRYHREKGLQKAVLNSYGGGLFLFS